MEAYSGFAEVYDLFMDNVPYEDWCRYLVHLLRRYGVKDGLVLELGCGTGKMTRLLAKAGYDMIGVDVSEEMLGIARQAESTGADILYLNQDMREFELYGTVGAVVSICDSMNYITEEEDLRKVFSLVNNYLDPGGIFVFDLNTLYKYRKVLGEQVICENREEGSFIWENDYDEAARLNEYGMTFFVREADGRYRKYEETHYQRAYEIEKIKELIENSGLEWVACYEAFGEQAPGADSERVYIIARECTKSKGGRAYVRLHRKGNGGKRTNPRICHHVKGAHRKGKNPPQHESRHDGCAWKAFIRRCHDGRHDERRKRSPNHTGAGQRPGKSADGNCRFRRACKRISRSGGCHTAAQCTGQTGRRRRHWHRGDERHKGSWHERTLRRANRFADRRDCR